ncbi:hypothetical protein QE152_g28520 [Popillia japonica]|uniref:Uncharacterized protein n=1 Tax=Popillia japonica TaxID=7064 RepID=A0AAW1JJQ5_POPJA
MAVTPLLVDVKKLWWRRLQATRLGIIFLLPLLVDVKKLWWRRLQATRLGIIFLLPSPESRATMMLSRGVLSEGFAEDQTEKDHGQLNSPIMDN